VVHHPFKAADPREIEAAMTALAAGVRGISALARPVSHVLIFGVAHELAAAVGLADWISPWLETASEGPA
jgi:hypothetical protein